MKDEPIALGAGALTEIVDIAVPSEASPGQTVNVQVDVKNINGWNFYLTATAERNGSGILLSPDYYYPASEADMGRVYPFTGSFIMPNQAVTIRARSYYWNGAEWLEDDSASTVIALIGGTISRKELQYDGDRATIPASDIPFGLEGLVHIWGRNDTGENQKMGIEWWVRNPSGSLIEHYLDWETFWTGPGNAQGFIGGRFDLNKEGDWTIQVHLLMNPDSPVVVFTYDDLLCTVLPESAGYDGTISKKELKFDSTRKTIPASAIPFGLEGLVHIWGRNDTGENQRMGIDWTVKDPAGRIVEQYTDWETLWTAPGNAQGFIGGRFDLNKEGDWTIQVHLLMNPGSPVVVNTYDDLLCTVLPEAELYEGTITRKELEYDSQQGPIPISNIPAGNRGLVHIWGRNDTDTSQKMGIAWSVTDPDGTPVEDYSHFETFWTAPGNAQGFIGGRFDMDKPGAYLITVVLLMNESNPVEVNSFDGELCQVTSENLAGKITEKELQYNGARKAIPAADIPQGKRGLVHVRGRNDTSSNQKMGIEWSITAPDGTPVEDYSHFETFWTAPGNAQGFIGDRFDLDQVGPYLISIRLLVDPDIREVVDSYDGDLCQVIAGGPGGELFDNLAVTYRAR